MSSATRTLPEIGKGMELIVVSMTLCTLQLSGAEDCNKKIRKRALDSNVARERTHVRHVVSPTRLWREAPLLRKDTKKWWSRRCCGINNLA